MYVMPLNKYSTFICSPVNEHLGSFPVFCCFEQCCCENVSQCTYCKSVFLGNYIQKWNNSVRRCTHPQLIDNSRLFPSSVVSVLFAPHAHQHVVVLVFCASLVYVKYLHFCSSWYHISRFLKNIQKSRQVFFVCFLLMQKLRLGLRINIVYKSA